MKFTFTFLFDYNNILMTSFNGAMPGLAHTLKWQQVPICCNVIFTSDHLACTPLNNIHSLRH